MSAMLESPHCRAQSGGHSVWWIGYIRVILIQTLHAVYHLQGNILTEIQDG